MTINNPQPPVVVEPPERIWIQPTESSLLGVGPIWFTRRTGDGDLEYVRSPSPDSIAEKADRLAATIIGRERLDYDWVRDLITTEFGAGGEGGHNDR